MRWKQRYKCKDCGYVFQNKSRARSGSGDKNIWRDYSVWKHTYAELSEKYHISIWTVQARLDAYVLPEKVLVPKPIILLIDTTYFGNMGVMAFKDAIGKKIIHCRLVTNESASDYKLWVKELQDEGWTIEGIVCDGKRWLLGRFGDIPTQMCQFHQVAIIRRYVTKKPKIQANKDLKILGELLTRTDKETFEYALDSYEDMYRDSWKKRASDQIERLATRTKGPVLHTFHWDETCNICLFGIIVIESSRYPILPIDWNDTFLILNPKYGFIDD